MIERYPIVHEHPPIYAEIVSVFPKVHTSCVVFAYYGKIYNPRVGVEIPPAMLRHEYVHLDRQGTTEKQAKEWWANYLYDPKFRYVEELLAHREEYRAMMENAPCKMRRMALAIVAKKLASPLYGQMNNIAKCKKDIEADI